MKTVYNVPGSL